MAKALSKAIRPKTMRIFVTRKKTASLKDRQLPAKVFVGRVSYSISSPSQRCHPSLVPDSMTHVPLFNAKVSTSQRYRVGRTMGMRVLEKGSPIMN